MSDEGLGWVKRAAGTRGVPAGLGNDTLVQFRLAGDPGVYDDKAGNLRWGDGPGAIASYRPLGPVGVGDVAGTTLGSAARFNAGKVDLSLIPAGMFAGLRRWDQLQVARHTPFRVDWNAVLMR